MICICVVGIFSNLFKALFNKENIMTKQGSNENLLAKLFRWKTTVKISDITFYIRIVGDAIIDAARKESLLASRRLRKLLRDVNSDEYFMYLDAMDDWRREELSAYIQISASKEVMRTYISENPKPQLDPLGDNPSQEDLENHEAAKIERDQQYIKDVQEYVEDWRLKFEADLSKLSPEDLLSVAKKYRVDEICDELFSKEFEDYVIAASIYTDSGYKNRAFTLQEYKELPSEIKKEFYDAYNNMNVGAEDLKN